MRYVIAALVVIAGCTPAAPDGVEEDQGNTQEADYFGKERGFPPPEAYLRAEDQRRARDGHDIPCTAEKHENGYAILTSLPTDQCFKMLPRARLRGVWINEFEASSFYPGVQAPPKDKSDFGLWLDVTKVNLGSEAPDGRAYLVEFEGRQTMYPGIYGHMGLFEHEVIVDRVISVVPLDS